MEKADKKIKIIWNIRLTLAAVTVGFFVSVFFQGIIWNIFTALWVITFLVMYLIYYPVKYKKLGYKLTKTDIFLNCGVIYTRNKIISIKNIHYVVITQTPLQRTFDVASVHIASAGGRAYFPGIKNSEAEALKMRLIPT